MLLMAEKEFKKKFMHPTRRKLVEMVHTGEYDKNTQISRGKKKEQVEREVGEEWTAEDGSVWVQKAGYKIKKTKNTDQLSKVRQSLESKLHCKAEKCDKKGQYGPTDKKLIKETGYCSNCLIEKEVPIRQNGDYEAYTKYRMYSNLYKQGLYYADKLQNAYDEAKQSYDYVDGDGKVQTWTLDRPVEELKEEIMEDLNHVQEELKLVKANLKELYSELKDKKYDLVEEMRRERDDRD